MGSELKKSNGLLDSALAVRRGPALLDNHRDHALYILAAANSIRAFDTGGVGIRSSIISITSTSFMKRSWTV